MEKKKKKYRFTWVEKNYMESFIEAENKDDAWEQFEVTKEFDDNTRSVRSETIPDTADLEEIPED